MVLRPWILAATLAAVMAFGGQLWGCGGSGQPTKEQLSGQLIELAAALEAGDTDKAAGHMMLPPGRSLDEMKPTLPKLVEKRDISSAGVKLLVEKGTFGPLATVFPEKGARRAKRMGLEIAECYALRFDRAEVMAHWTGDSFKIFRVDDIGKIAK